ncbi:DUF1801 domain-containing protein [Bogoriella caseilytica]|uniref:Uncharacterized protein DUF1801 n=1 Tax=Bogoriella caseilytica TaxID=56055 RepID=A0A3N2BA82_9MICO|nr:DUF1801 domain-containing protein [Bogoriella caseilytica]ROR72166.1 uncharacterized protein DUF1801 [Bogoriella caseilytica]
MDELSEYLDSVTPARRRDDARTLLALMAEVTGEQPVLHRGGIIGFGTYHYQYASGREGDSIAAGFAPRKAATTIYLMNGVDRYTAELAELGPHTLGVGCLYIKDLSAIDLDALRAIVRDSYETLTSGTYGQRAGED